MLKPPLRPEDFARFAAEAAAIYMQKHGETAYATMIKRTGIAPMPDRKLGFEHGLAAGFSSAIFIMLQMANSTDEIDDDTDLSNFF